MKIPPPLTSPVTQMQFMGESEQVLVIFHSYIKTKKQQEIISQCPKNTFHCHDSENSISPETAGSIARCFYHGSGELSVREASGYRFGLSGCFAQDVFPSSSQPATNRHPSNATRNPSTTVCWISTIDASRNPNDSCPHGDYDSSSYGSFAHGDVCG